MNILLKHWHFNFISVILMAVLTLLYLYFIYHKKNNRAGYFITAMFLFIICTCSPIQWLGTYYLFSMHMITHVTLFLIVSPLLLLSIPSQTNTNRFSKMVSEVIASIPWLAWIIGISIMWFWHIPVIFDNAMPVHAAGVDGFLHHVQGISLIVTGLIFWWPVMGPFKEYRLAAPKGIIYLFTACISCSLLGLLITFSPVGMYSYYGTLGDPFGFSAVIRKGWGISMEMDQQTAGLIMWVPGCLIYLTSALYLLRKWFMEKDDTIIDTHPSFHIKTEEL